MKTEIKADAVDHAVDQAEMEAELGNMLYAAGQLIEQLERAGHVRGNGHHARQCVAAFGVAELRARWIHPEPKSSAYGNWRLSTAQRLEPA